MNILPPPPRWVERTFPSHLAIEMAPVVWSRLAGAIARVKSIAALAEGLAPPKEGWTIAQHIGHLGDLESLALVRLDDFDAGADVLHAADMTNRATEEAHHNDFSLTDRASYFARGRAELLHRTAAMSADQWARSALHPRLKTPMRVIDLMEFFCEHDDHHLAQASWLLAQSGRESFDDR